MYLWDGAGHGIRGVCGGAGIRGIRGVRGGAGISEWLLCTGDRMPASDCKINQVITGTHQ